MEEINAMATSLGEKIRASESYQKYCYFKSRLEQDALLKQKLNYFQKSQFELQSAKAQGFEVDTQQEKSLSDDYFRFMLNEDCSGYLNYESEVIQILSQVFDAIEEQVKVDVSFLD